MKAETCFLFLSLFLVALSGNIFAQDAETTPEPLTSISTHVPSTESPTDKPTTTIPLTSTKTTTEAVPTTTPTTTEKPTTTHEPTTSTHESTSTTHAITTTEVPTTTTTVSPQPVTPIFEVKDKNGNFCITVQALTSVKITYMDLKNATQSKDFDLKEEEVKASGECGPNATFIELRWVPKNGGHIYWDLKINFEKMPASGLSMVAQESETYGVNKINFNYTIENSVFHDAASIGNYLVEATGTFFKARVGNYYSCNTKETIELKGTKSESVLMHTQDTKIEAYSSTAKKDTFVGAAESCSADSPASNLVPILVGVGLAVMILIALAVFLIGSRRRAATYESL